jgi:Rieske Fe-S protein
VADRARTIRRRGLLTGACALGLSSFGSAGADPGDAEPPQENDLLTFAFGERAGEAIAPGDLAVGEAQVFAYAMDPVSRLVRNGTRLYQLVLIRLDPDWLSDVTRERAVDGIVAYSGICSHTGCDVEDWDASANRFQCPCHESQFDPSDGARVVGGPAPWPLAALPLKLEDGRLAVARPFEGRVGFQQPGLSPFGI